MRWILGITLARMIIHTNGIKSFCKISVPYAIMTLLHIFLLGFFQASVWYPMHSTPTRSHCVSSDQATIALRRGVLCCFRSHGVHVSNVWRIDAATNVWPFLNRFKIVATSVLTMRSCSASDTETAFLAIPDTPRTFVSRFANV